MGARLQGRINARGAHKAEKSGVCKEYRSAGVNKAIEAKPRRGAPAKIDGRVEATVTMLACADPPEGYGRWTLQ